MNRKLTGLILASIFLIAGVFAVSIGWNAIEPVIQQYTDQQQAASDIRDRVTDGEYAQREYEWFKTQEEKIKSQQRQIENQRQQIRDFKEINNMEDLSYTEQRQYNRMTDRLLGYRNQYESLVADYNARMNMETRSLYNDSLPLEMESKFWTGDLIP